MNLSLVVVSAGSREEAGLCLRSLHEQTRAPREIIFVDDTPGQELASWIRVHWRDTVRVIANGGNKGAAYSRNRGVEHAREEHVLFLDSDCCLDPDFLASLDRLEEILRDGKIGGCSFNVCGPRGIFTQGIKLDALFRAHNLTGLADEVREVECLNTCCCLMKKELFHRRGFLERYNYIFEDVEFSLYARAHGYIFVYFPFARAYHKGGSYPASGAQKMFYSYRNRLWTLLAQPPRRKMRVLSGSLGYEIARAVKMFCYSPCLFARASLDIARAGRKA